MSSSAEPLPRTREEIRRKRLIAESMAALAARGTLSKDKRQWLRAERRRLAIDERKASRRESRRGS